jgi:hypothetical protein
VTRLRGFVSHTLLALAEAGLVATLIATLVFGTALAGRPSGGGGGHGGKGGSYSATLVVTPNPVPAGGAMFSVTGSGFPQSGMVGISIANPGCCLAFNVAADSSGSISFSYTTGSAGSYVIKAYKYGTTTIVAQTTFTVQ